MRPEFSTLKRIVAILIALVVVLAAGAVIGQAPAIFGVDEEPEASIEFDDQQGDGTSATVTTVSVSDGGFVVVTDSSGNTVGISDYLESGTHENVTVNQTTEEDFEMVGQLTATTHHDSTDDETYAYNETDGEEDRPYIEDGYPVSDTATVTMTDRDDDAVSDSFSVESIDAPSTATTNETITVTAEVRNPTDDVDDQHVDLRLDGAVLERQVLELEPEESQDVEFNIDTNGADPGNQTIGVYTSEDGAVEMIDLEFDGTPDVEPVDGNETSVTANAITPADGFVAVEDASEDDENGPSPNGAGDAGEALGTSEELSPGDHENVTVDLEDSVSEDDELRLILYEGDSDDIAGATQVETEDGTPVEAEFTLEELADGDDE